MNRTLSLRYAAYTVLALALLAAVIMPIAASGDSAQRLYLGMNLHFTGPDTSAGTFVVSGAVADSGTVAGSAHHDRPDRKQRPGASLGPGDLYRPIGNHRHSLRRHHVPALESTRRWASECSRSSPVPAPTPVSPATGHSRSSWTPPPTS